MGNSVERVEFQLRKIKKFWRWTVVIAAQQCERTYYHRTGHLKMVRVVYFITIKIIHIQICTQLAL